MSRAPGDAVVVAVDGGGVKTDLALLDLNGRLLAVVRGGRSQVHYVGVEGCVEVLESLLDGAVARAGLPRPEQPFAAAEILVAGADLPEERAALEARIRRLRWSERLVVDNDTLALLRAGTARGWGVAVVCGAGINCVGLAPDGRQVRFPSLGAISGDWGGGGDVGLAALAAAARSADGRGPRTALESAVPAHFELRSPLDVARALHLEQMPKARLGELARVVLALSGQDPVAAAIVGRLGEEVIAFAAAVLRRLELTDADPDVVLGGSLLRAVAPAVVDSIARGVREVAPRANVRVAPSEPIVGAALLALGALGGDARASERAREELDAALAAITVAPPPTGRRSSSLPPPASR